MTAKDITEYLKNKDPEMEVFVWDSSRDEYFPLESISIGKPTPFEKKGMFSEINNYLPNAVLLD